MGKIIAQHSNIVQLIETNYIWLWGNYNRADDLLTEADLNPKIQKHIEKKFIESLKKYNKSHICDKTPRNCLRIPFVRAIFTDAKIIHIIRDDRAVMCSIEDNFDVPKQVIWKEILSRIKTVSI